MRRRHRSSCRLTSHILLTSGEGVEGAPEDTVVEDEAAAPSGSRLERAQRIVREANDLRTAAASSSEPGGALTRAVAKATGTNPFQEASIEETVTVVTPPPDTTAHFGDQAVADASREILRAGTTDAFSQANPCDQDSVVADLLDAGRTAVQGTQVSARGSVATAPWVAATANRRYTTPPTPVPAAGSRV